MDTCFPKFAENLYIFLFLPDKIFIASGRQPIKQL
jgi:hypothetical protein